MKWLGSFKSMKPLGMDSMFEFQDKLSATGGIIKEAGAR